MNQAEFQALLEKQINKGNVYNAVAGAQSQDGSVDLVGAAGIADPETGARMTPHTPYSLASITKMYTAAAILRLHEQGRLDLDEPISRYLPASLNDGIHVYKGKDYSHEIKVYHLVSQTSGLADYFLDKPKGGQSVFDDLSQGHDVALDVEQVVAIVRKLSPWFEPSNGNRIRAHYADTNYRLLGAIIESVTDAPVVDNFEWMIFAPLGLRDTYLYNAAAARPDQAPAAIYLKEQTVRLPRFFSSNTTDGGMISTVCDNLVILRAFFDGKLFDPKLFDRMMQRWDRIFFPMQYGYGMMRVNFPRIMMPEFIGHSGSTGSFAYYCPDKGLYLVGTMNQIAAPSRPIRLMRQIATAVA